MNRELAFAVLTVSLAIACGERRAGDNETRDASHDAAQNDAAPDAPGASDASAPDVGFTERQADGTVGEWRELEPMPLPRANFCSAVVGEDVFAIGGNYRPDGKADFVKIDAVHAAATRSDGTIGSWRLSGALPAPLTECVATAWGRRLLVMGGLYDDVELGRTVWAAEVSGDGTLEPWSSVGTLPGDRTVTSSEAWVHGDALLLVDAELSPEPVTDALWLPLAGVGSWSVDSWLAEWRGQAQYAFTGAFVYSMGGYLGPEQSNVVSTAVYGAAVAEDGSVGATFKGTDLPEALAFGEAIAIDGYLFVIGGKPAIFGAAAVQSVWSAAVGPDGRLGPWQAQTSLPEGRTNLEAVLAGDFLYVLGGGNEGPGLDQVWSAQVRH